MLRYYSSNELMTDNSGFISYFFLNTMAPTIPARVPLMAASSSAISTFNGGLKAKGASSPGMGDAVPGALLIMPRNAAATPEKPPPKKLEQ